MNLKVGVHEFYPIVYKKDGVWKGFEIELWEKVAEENGFDFTYHEESSLSGLIQGTKDSYYDIGMAGITRTVDRSKLVSFSFLTLATGLIIGVKENKSFSAKELLGRVFSLSVMRIFGILLLFVGLVAHIYWFIEKGKSVALEYGAGIFDAVWWTLVTFSTVGYGDIYPVTMAGKMFGVVAILIGLAIFGLFIAQLSASLTERRISSRVMGVEDLKRKKIALKAGTTAVSAVTAHGGVAKSYTTVDDAVKSVLSGETDAVVADAPSLQLSEKYPELLLVGGLFAHQSYSFIVPKESAILDSVNSSLVALRNQEGYDVIINKYFN